MGTIKRTAVVLMSGLLLGTASARAWSADNKSAALTANTVAAKASDRSLLGMLAPILTDPVQHQAQKNCGPSGLYSQHDVVGDPEACFMGRINAPGTSGSAVGGAPTL